jgi:hypothetical protein
MLVLEARGRGSLVSGEASGVAGVELPVYGGVMA